jgi:hypothetical protein
MSFGLITVETSIERNLREEFITYTDDFILEALKSINTPPGLFNDLDNYSRSYYTQQGHLESILKYNKINKDPPSTVEWNHTQEQIRQEFASYPKVRSLSAKTEERDFQRVKYHQGTSAGYGYNGNPHPHPSHKGSPIQNNFKRATKIASKIVHACNSHHLNGTWKEFLSSIPMDSTPDVAFTRTQLTELPKLKVRNVFGEAFHYVLLEGLFAQPLIQQFMLMDTFYFIGLDPVIGVTKLIEGIPPDREQFAVFDWSGFDSSVHVYEIEFAFSLLKSMLIFPDKVTELIFEYVQTLFVSRKLASPDGRIFLRTGGIPSGSYFTHIIGSIINYVRIKYLLNRLNITHDLIRTHGDDCLVTLIDHVEDITGIVQEAAQEGWFINVTKSQLVQNKHEIEFLGRYSKFGTNYRDALRGLRLLVYPEYPVDDPQISIARLKGIDTDTGNRLEHIPQVYNYLANRYGDENIMLPKQFRKFDVTKHYTESTPTAI